MLLYFVLLCALYTARNLLTDSQPKSSGLVGVSAWRHFTFIQSYELSQWVCDDDSAINIVLELS